MKTVTKEFWVSDYTLNAVKRGTFAPVEKNHTCKHKVTISWEEEEKKITLSEEEFDVVFDEFFSRKVFPETYIKFKQKLFGDKNE